MKHTAAVILAAGKGTRMKAPSTKNKVTFEIGDRPIIAYTVDHVREAGIKDIFVVVGYARESVEAVLKKKVKYIYQPVQQGTGDAIKVALKSIDHRFQTVLSLYGDDSAFYPPELLSSMVVNHQVNQSDLSFLSLLKANPKGLGRIIRDKEGQIIGIVEEKVATEKQKKIIEVNAGLYCFKRDFIDANIHKIKCNSVSKEYYLTDIIEIARKNQAKITGFIWTNNIVWFGVNTPDELRIANQLKQRQRELENISIPITTAS